MYSNPNQTSQGVDGDQCLKEGVSSQQHFDDFFEDIYYELRNFGKLEELSVCANAAPHLFGNVYVKYRHEEDAHKALTNLEGRFYGGKPIVAEFSPVTDLRQACCRQFDLNECSRGGLCSFMHLKNATPSLYKKLMGHPKEGRDKAHGRGECSHHREKDRSYDRDRHHSYRRERSRERNREKDKEHRSSSSRKRRKSRDRHKHDDERDYERSRSRKRKRSSRERSEESERSSERERKSREKESSGRHHHDEYKDEAEGHQHKEQQPLPHEVYSRTRQN